MDDLQHLIDGHLDHGLSADEAARLDRCLAADPAAAERFVRSVLLHDRLGDLFRAARDPAIEPAPASAAIATPAPRAGAGRLLPVAAAVALVVAVGVFARQAAVPAWAAAGSLERALAATSQAVDREYLIRVLDHGPDGPPAPVPSGRGGRKPGIDGGRLFVRGGDAFVLMRRFADGSLFVNGSDGTIGWSVPPRGSVHLSHDTRRFRRGVPGEREEIPFLDLRSGLDGLRRGYRLSVGAVDGTAPPETVQVLEARRRPARGRGPDLVRVWLDAAGVPRRIELHGLPADRPEAHAGSVAPPAVALDLVAESDLGPDFFDHRAHHATDRPTDWE